jgi:ATP-binding cassette subfamily B protein/subfamily B ATP-binding cassette protein MsbA
VSVAENIAYGRPGAYRAEVEAAARAANADAFIERLPAGYDTVLSERGATLSGGECQRVAIARALLKDAPILILDEPTAALDVGTEALVIEALHRLVRQRTTFIIAHRLATLRRADRIVLLQDGKITELPRHVGLVHPHDIALARAEFRGGRAVR